MSSLGNDLASIINDDPCRQEYGREDHPDAKLAKTPRWIIPKNNKIDQHLNKEIENQDRDEILPELLDNRLVHTKRFGIKVF